MHPILFEVPTPWGAIPIYSYGVMLGTSLLVAWYFMMWAGARKENFNRELMANTFTITAIGAIIGSRILYILTNLDDFEDFSKWFDIRSGGLVAYGGFLGGFFTAWAYLKANKVPLLPWADVVVPTLGSGLMLTRIGCYLYGCDFGKTLGDSAPSWLAKLGTFPRWSYGQDPKFACDQVVSGSPAFHHHLSLYAEQMAGRTESLPVHPTQLYESLAGLTLFLTGVWLLEHRKFRGQVFVTICGLYAIWRFFVEYLRDDPERGFAFGFSTSQLVSMAILPLCAYAYIELRKRAARDGDIQLPKHALEPRG